MQNKFDIVQYVSNQRSAFEAAISDEKVIWEKECQYAVQAFHKNEYLLTMARNNPISVQSAIINVAAIGVTLNPAEKLAYLVPRDGGVCLDISYMGLIEIAVRSGSVVFAQSFIVYDDERFTLMGVGQPPVHERNPFREKGKAKPIGAYCVAKTHSGDFLVEVMSRDEIYDIRDRSAAWKAYVSKKKSCPWVTDELEMWRKTVIKRGYKYWPRSERLSNAIENLNTAAGEGIEINNGNQIKDVPHIRHDEMINPLNAIRASLEANGKSESELCAWLNKAAKLPTLINSLDDLNEAQLIQVANKLEARK